jgi:hypothetical protein
MINNVGASTYSINALLPISNASSSAQILQWTSILRYAVDEINQNWQHSLELTLMDTTNSSSKAASLAIQAGLNNSIACVGGEESDSRSVEIAHILQNFQVCLSF